MSWNDPHILKFLYSGNDFMILESGYQAEDLWSGVNKLSAKEYMLSLVKCLNSIQTFWNNGCYHADLKPLNLLVFKDFNTSELQARVIDISPVQYQYVTQYNGGTKGFRFTLNEINAQYNLLMNNGNLTEPEVRLAVAQDIKAIGKTLDYALHYYGGYVQDPSLINDLKDFINRTKYISTASDYYYMKSTFQNILYRLHQTFITL